ncbi:MAG: hypothetical protein IJE53_02885 [Bacilli bacterium]|nr:hypothetical protein [Bacilli bacterium]
MKKIEEEKLEMISGGGTTITGTLVSAISEVFKVLYDAGHAVGSSIRRMNDKSLCPID